MGARQTNWRRHCRVRASTAWHITLGLDELLHAALTEIPPGTVIEAACFAGNGVAEACTLDELSAVLAADGGGVASDIFAGRGVAARAACMEERTSYEAERSGEKYEPEDVRHLVASHARMVGVWRAVDKER